MMNTTSSRLFSAFSISIFLVTLFALFFLNGCEKTVCLSDSDCPSGTTCSDSKCKSIEQEPGTGEPTKVEHSKENAGDASTPEGKSEDIVEEGPKPPPLPEQKWSEGRFPPPEHLKSSQFPDGFSQGKRKKDETCNPSLTALPQDKCEKGLLCVAPGLGNVGICMPSCDAKNPSCSADRICGPVYSIENRTLVGHACGHPVERGYSCTFGWYCKKGDSCVPYGDSTRGTCQKACKATPECGKDSFCAEVTSFPDTNQKDTACKKMMEKEGESCDGTFLCGANLVCVGSTGERVCRPDCATNPKSCKAGTTCITYKNYKGEIYKAACLPVLKEDQICNSTVRCGSGLSCAYFSSTRNLPVCLRNCTKDPKVCKADQVCVTFNSRTKLCYKKDLKEGELCQGPHRCAKGLVCRSPGPQQPAFCFKPCEKDPKVCGTKAQCQQLDSKRSICVQSCSIKNGTKCTWSLFQCVAAQGKESCQPNAKQLAGKLAVGKRCHTHPTAPADQRCAEGLNCTKLADGWFCTQPCTPSQPNCPSGQKCLLHRKLKTSFCAKEAPAGAACDVSQGILCAAGHQCQHKTFHSQGTCSKESIKARDELCQSEFFPCKDGDLCAGDPWSPYRWTCRQKCSSTSPNCPAKQKCLSLVKGGACFETCETAQKICNQRGFQCKTIQSQKICL